MSKPRDCFGDDHYYSETSRGCIRCPYYSKCGEEVNNKAYRRSWTSSSSTRRSVAPSTATTAVRKVPAVVRNISQTNSYYNFDERILPQLARYAGFSIAEVCLEELHTLIQQAREDYIDRSTDVIETTVVEAIKPTKK